MKCPECAAEYTFAPQHCPCGHVFSAAPRPSLYKGTDDDAHFAHAGQHRPPAPMSLYKGSNEDAYPAFRLPGPFRKCAKCGSVMALSRVEKMFLNGLIPSGKSLYFRCQNCGKVIKVRSLWRNLLALPGCFLFPIFCAVFASSPNWLLGLLAACLGFYPFMLLREIVVRTRYPTVAAPSTNAVDKE
jgi:hypothetical protein